METFEIQRLIHFFSLSKHMCTKFNEYICFYVGQMIFTEESWATDEQWKWNTWNIFDCRSTTLLKRHHLNDHWIDAHIKFNQRKFYQKCERGTITHHIRAHCTRVCRLDSVQRSIDRISLVSALTICCNIFPSETHLCRTTFSCSKHFFEILYLSVNSTSITVIVAGGRWPHTNFVQ